MKRDPNDWLERRYHRVGRPAPWEVPGHLREAVERVRDRIEALLEGVERPGDRTGDPPHGSDVLDLAIVLHVVDPVSQVGVEVEPEPTRGVVTRWTPIQDGASVIDMWFSRHTASTNTSVWIDERPAMRVGDFIVDAGGHPPIPVGFPTETVAAPPAPVDASRTATRRRLETRERVHVALGLAVGDVLFGGLRSAWKAASTEVEIESLELGAEAAERLVSPPRFETRWLVD